MVSIPFLSGPERAFVIYDRLPPTESFTEFASHYATVKTVEHFADSGPGKNIPTGFATLRYIIEGEERLLHAPLDMFRVVPRSEVPQDFIHALDAADKVLPAAMAKADKDFLKAEKKNAADHATAVADLAAVFKRSRDFWLAWTGHGTPPVDPVTGELSTERQPPAI